MRETIGGRATALVATLTIAGLGGLPGGAAWAGSAEGPVPGAYCPLPEEGEVRECLSPAQDEYRAFFGALDDEDALDAAARDVERDVARGSDAPDAYLALSSLAYGYYRLATRAAAHEESDPAVVQRLARWNDLLALAYAESPDDTAYRDAVRRAAEELRARAPLALPCRDADGTPTECTSTEGVLRGIQAQSERVGLRGALSRLLRRVIGDGS